MHLEICVEELDSGQVKYFKDLSIYVGPKFIRFEFVF